MILIQITSKTDDLTNSIFFQKMLKVSYVYLCECTSPDMFSVSSRNKN